MPKKFAKKKRSHDYVQTSKGRTKQSDRGPSINELVNRFMHSGQRIPQLPWDTADLSNFDYASQRNAVADFNSHFAELPSDVRDAFDNDPSGYLDFLQENSEDIEAHGLSKTINDVLTPPEEVSDDETAQSAEKTAEIPDDAAEQTSSPT